MRELIEAGHNLLEMKRKIVKMMAGDTDDKIIIELKELNKIINKTLLKVLKTIKVEI